MTNETATAFKAGDRVRFLGNGMEPEFAGMTGVVQATETGWMSVPDGVDVLYDGKLPEKFTGGSWRQDGIWSVRSNELELIEAAAPKAEQPGTISPEKAAEMESRVQGIMAKMKAAPDARRQPMPEGMAFELTTYAVNADGFLAVAKMGAKYLPNDYSTALGVLGVDLFVDGLVRQQPLAGWRRATRDEIEKAIRDDQDMLRQARSLADSMGMLAETLTEEKPDDTSPGVNVAEKPSAKDDPKTTFESNGVPMTASTSLLKRLGIVG